MNKWTWSVVGAFVIWAVISSFWYVCGVKGFCQDTSVEITPSTISINENVDDSVAERPNDNVRVNTTPVTTNQVTETVTREKVVQCDAYLDTYLRRGYSNSSDDMRRLEDFLNTYEDEDLVVNGVFDSSDERAVERFQEKYRSEVLTPWGLSAPTGYVYRTTRDHINKLYCAYASVENN